MFVNGVIAGEDTADEFGVWSITSSSELGDGVYAITAQQTDVAGNVGEVSDALSVTIDTTVPTAPSILDLDAAYDSGVYDYDNLTNIQKVLLTGTGIDGELVTITSSFGGVDNVLGTVTVDIDGNYSFMNTVNLAEGVHNITASVTDIAGNVGTSDALEVTIDISAPEMEGGLPVNGSTVLAEAVATIDFGDDIVLLDAALVTLHD